MVGKPVNPKCGLLVECVGNRHDDNNNSSNRSTVQYVIFRCYRDLGSIILAADTSYFLHRVLRIASSRKYFMI